ncbi:hypothetical protein [Halococcus sp. IIIV-5B]|uniref:hypothetical protein n=1 Tax=Halococcus sp. IIIV-5B TaxID=2321230 RepID=UPI000E7667E8|nr:hypothetical protein [Halococcus sp. IIIV-5B]RJT06557.1 hypothetical protein D3261_05730 [Halococcus sp. IIIV-5B]
MPITEREWDDGEFDTDEDAPRTNSVGDYETDKDLILAFLAENAEKAYTKPEIHRGVDFGETDDPETIHEKLSSLPNTLVDLAGDAVATGLVSDDIDAALDELVAEGTVTEKQLDRDGESVTHYRLNQVE